MLISTIVLSSGAWYPAAWGEPVDRGEHDATDPVAARASVPRPVSARRRDKAPVRPFTPGDLIAEALMLLDKGWSRTEVLRQLSALRRSLHADDGGQAVAITDADIREVRTRVAAGAADRPRVLVASRDAVIRTGLDGALTRSGVLSWATDVDDLEAICVAPWDYVLVWLRATRGLDPYDSIRLVDALGTDFSQTPVVAVHDRPLPPEVRLRLAEAGFRYLVPLAWLSDAMPEIASVLSTANIPLAFHLETPLAMRERMGLRLSGDLESFLREALALPDQVWTGHLPQSHLPIPRSVVRRMRRLSRELAGLPPPDFGVYATSAFRTPPEEPEWPRVRGLVRSCLDLDAAADTTYHTSTGQQ